MKEFKIFIKEWLIGKLGGIPMSYFTKEELQKFYNRKLNEKIDKDYYEILNNGFK